MDQARVEDTGSAPSEKAKLELPVITGILLVALMMVSVTIGLVQLGHRAAPTWRSGYLIGLALFLSLEAAYTRRSTRDMESSQRLIFRLSEWAAFAILVKLLTYLDEPARILSDVVLWQESLLNFLDIEYLIAMMLSMLIWFSAGAFAEEIEQIYDRDQKNEWDDLGKLQNVLQDLRRRMTARIFILGAVVVLMAVLTRVDATAVLRALGQNLPGYNAPVANVLAYFIFGLVLLSQTQYALMRTRWQWQNLVVSPTIPANWVRYSVVFFVLLAVIAFFLPTEYSLGFFDTLRVVIDMLFTLVSFLLMAIMLPLTACMSLFRFASGAEMPPPALPPALPPAPEANAPVSWWAFVRSLLFWIITAVILFMVFNYYIRQNKALLKVLRSFPVLRWLGRGWGSFWRWLRGVNRQVIQVVSTGIRRLRPPRVAPAARAFRRMINLQRLSPREKVIHYYLNLVKMGGEHGVERKPAQTPYQYESSLAKALPDVDHELLEFTDTFIEARYSQHPVEEPRAREAGSLWEKVKTALQNLKGNV